MIADLDSGVATVLESPQSSFAWGVLRDHLLDHDHPAGEILALWPQLVAEIWELSGTVRRIRAPHSLECPRLTRLYACLVIEHAPYATLSRAELRMVATARLHALGCCKLPGYVDHYGPHRAATPCLCWHPLTAALSAERSVERWLSSRDWFSLLLDYLLSSRKIPVALRANLKRLEN